MKLLALTLVLGIAGAGYWFIYPAPATYSALPEPVAVSLQKPVPPQTTLRATPRSRFTPTTRKGYYSLDIVSDFTLPATKTITFCGAGRNLHVQQDRDKIFRRGFSAVDQSRMVPNVEIWQDGNPARGWQSVLKQSQRSWIVYQNHFRDAFGLAWAQNSEKASETMYRALPDPRNASARVNRQTLFQASSELRGGCMSFGDCPPGMEKYVWLYFPGHRK